MNFTPVSRKIKAFARIDAFAGSIARVFKLDVFRISIGKPDLASAMAPRHARNA